MADDRLAALIFAAALAHPGVYMPQIRALARRGVTVGGAVREVMVADVQEACELFRGAWEASEGVNGRVSLEVDPGLAGDCDATVLEAVRLVRAVVCPNLYVKIPATTASLPAVTDALALGVDVNVTLVFSVERYREVMAAYLAGLERALEHGVPLYGVHSVASIFVSRVDVEGGRAPRRDRLGRGARAAGQGRPREFGSCRNREHDAGGDVERLRRTRLAVPNRQRGRRHRSCIAG